MYDSLVELAERFNKSYAPAEKEIIKAKLASGETLTTAKADETIISHLLWLLDAYRIRHRTEPTLQEVIAIYRAMLEIPGNSITVQTKPLYRGDASKKMTITKTKIAEWLKKIDSHDISLRTEIDLYAALLKYSNAREELDHFLDLDRNDIDSAI